MNRASALVLLKPGGERRQDREPSLVRKLFGLPGQGLPYLFDLAHVFPNNLDFLRVLPYDSQREDQNHYVESGKDKEKNVPCFPPHFSSSKNPRNAASPPAPSGASFIPSGRRKVTI